jgi:aminoglycoside 6'-N-acetyltransferase
MELRGERVVLRPVQEEDVEPLLAIAREPEVARWWNEVERDDVLPPSGDETVTFVVLVDGERAGLAQYAEENEPDYRAASIDLYLGSAWHGRGLGTETVRTLARHLVEERGHHRLTIDPAAENGAAIRSYEKVGFRRVGIMREYWRDADGTWRDGLLLDLLAAELTDAK